MVYPWRFQLEALMADMGEMEDTEGDVLDLGDITWFGEEEGEELEDEEIFNLDSGWSVDAFETGSSSMGLDLGKTDDEEELGMAAQQILSSIPMHKIRELEVAQQEADELNEERRKGKVGGTKPKTQRRLRIIGGTASGVRIHSQVRETWGCAPMVLRLLMLCCVVPGQPRRLGLCLSLSSLLFRSLLVPSLLLSLSLSLSLSHACLLQARRHPDRSLVSRLLASCHGSMPAPAAFSGAVRGSPGGAQRSPQA